MNEAKTNDAAAPAEQERPKRMTLSHVVEMLLARGSGERSMVEITRNAKGEVQLGVTVRAGEHGDVVTVEDAERKAREVYERLRTRYPLSNGHDNASIEVNRNAKGETQVAVEVKTADGGVATLEAAAEKALAVYDQTRGRYPMTDGGLSAKPGSVKP